jgi:hypothetical protein
MVNEPIFCKSLSVEVWSCRADGRGSCRAARPVEVAPSRLPIRTGASSCGCGPRSFPDPSDSPSSVQPQLHRDTPPAFSNSLANKAASIHPPFDPIHQELRFHPSPRPLCMISGASSPSRPNIPNTSTLQSQRPYAHRPNGAFSQRLRGTACSRMGFRIRFGSVTN